MRKDTNEYLTLFSMKVANLFVKKQALSMLFIYRSASSSMELVVLIKNIIVCL